MQAVSKGLPYSVNNFINRIFHLRDGEATVVLGLGFVLLANSLSIEVSNIVSVSGVLESGGVNKMLIVWIIDWLLIIAATAGQSLLIDRFNRARLLGWVCLVFAGTYIFLRLLFFFHVPEWINYSLLYFLTDQQWLFFPLFFWVLANDIYDPAQAKRLFPLISSFSFSGKLIGILFALVSPRLFSWLGMVSTEILLLNICLYLIAYAIVKSSLRSVKVRQVTVTTENESLREQLSEGWNFVKEVLSFRYLAVALLALAVCDTIIEFRFLAVIDSATGQNFQVFYSYYKFGTTILAILLQSLATGRVIERLGLKNSFLIMPLIAILSMGSLIVSASPVSAVFAYALLKLADGTLNESSRKSFQSLIPEERRGRVSMFMDSYLLAIGTIVGSLITAAVILSGQLLNHQTPQQIYLILGMGAALLALAATILMRRVYDQSLLNWRLKRRQRGNSILDKISF
jgi:ATP:ADP antiporter, AAA family